MSFTKNNLKIKSPKLKGEIVESILRSLCVKEQSINQIVEQVQQKLILFSPNIIKKHLVYLIDFDLVSYNGQTKKFIIEEGGIDLLQRIYFEKNKEPYGKEITITLER